MKVLGIALGVAAIVGTLFLLFSVFWAYAWNEVFVPVFSLGQIDIWQAFLMLLAIAIVGGMFKTNVDVSKRR
jgi:hypothetical protein